MPRLGAHMSIAGGLEKALVRGRQAGCEVIQIFTRHRVRWSARAVSDQEAASFDRTRQQTSVCPVSIHNSYLINFASPYDKVRHNSLRTFLEEMTWAERLHIPYVVMHPGAHLGEGESKGLRRISDAVNQSLDITRGSGACILLETTAGQGTSLGYRFEHLADILTRAPSAERLGVCLDTCHVFAAGYDLRTPDTYEKMIEAIEGSFGIAMLRLFHINDSRGDLGSRLDRHQHLGKGHIGLKGLANILNDPRFASHPFLLETPKGKDSRGVDLDIRNLEILRKITRKNKS